jgi:hypothetical protein
LVLGESKGSTRVLKDILDGKITRNSTRDF